MPRPSAAVVRQVVSFAGQAADTDRMGGLAAARPFPGRGIDPGRQVRPRWDRPSRTLTLRGQVVKQFLGRARDQIALLDLLERLNWPCYVEDALGALDGTRRKKRLHHAIWRLNAAQGYHGLRFHGYAEGHGIWWEPAGR